MNLCTALAGWLAGWLRASQCGPRPSRGRKGLLSLMPHGGTETQRLVPGLAGRASHAHTDLKPCTGTISTSSDVHSITARGSPAFGREGFNQYPRRHVCRPKATPAPYDAALGKGCGREAETDPNSRRPQTSLQGKDFVPGLALVLEKTGKLGSVAELRPFLLRSSWPSVSPACASWQRNPASKPVRQRT